MTQSSTITVIKNDHTGHEVWRYEGTIIERGEHHLVLEAHFNRDDVDLGYVTFQRGDRFVETFYDDRWYCVFEVHAVDDAHLKGWYCNIGRPAQITVHTIEQDDLALDVWVTPDHTPLILDRDEFEDLPISDAERQQALQALANLQRQAARGQPPFVARG